MNYIRAPIHCIICSGAIVHKRCSNVVVHEAEEKENLLQKKSPKTLLTINKMGKIIQIIETWKI